MKKSLSAVLVVILSVLGFRSQASAFDLNVQGEIKETTDLGGSVNQGGKACGSKRIKVL